MYHCKVIIVDGVWVSVGSTNFDDRSFRLNDEANLNVYDPAFVQEQEAVFEGDLKHSHRVTYAEWKNRPATEKVMEQVSSFLASQL
jgi:cardiolipin synthase